MDADGYPDQDELEKIANWPAPDFSGLLDRVEALWRYPEYFRKKGRTYRLSTGGWSGNEDLIEALRENRIFWVMCWQQSRRGGHFVFRAP